MKIISVNTTLDTYKEEFFKRMKDKARNTLKEYRRSIGRLYFYMKQHKIENIEDITDQNIRDFQLSLFKIGNSQTTIRYHIKTIKRYCGFLIKWDLLKSDPFKYCDIVPSPERLCRPKRYYSHQEAMRRYFSYLRNHYGYRISKDYLNNLRTFIQYLEEKNIKSVCSVKSKDVTEYTEYLWGYRLPSGKNYTSNSIRNKLEDVKKFYRAFFIEGLIDKNPSKELNISRFLRKKLPDTRPRQIILEKAETIFDKLALEFKSYTTTRGFAEKTMQRNMYSLGIFFEWLEKRFISDPREVTKHVIMDYYKDVHKMKTPKGDLWAPSTKYHHLVIIRKFFQFLSLMDYVGKDPTEYIELPKKERGLPVRLLKDSEARILLDSVETEREFGLRNKAIMELLYSTGMRSNELCSLDVHDIDFERRQVVVRFPKGGRSYQRVLPFGDLASKALKEYIRFLRPELVKGSSKALFLSAKGNRMNVNGVWGVVKEYVTKGKVNAKITTHSFRVACATEMLRNGADIRYVQELLGHKCLETTRIYTRVNIEDLKKAHKRFHPREKYYRKAKKYISDRRISIENPIHLG